MPPIDEKNSKIFIGVGGQLYCFRDIIISRALPSWRQRSYWIFEQPHHTLGGELSTLLLLIVQTKVTAREVVRTLPVLARSQNGTYAVQRGSWLYFAMLLLLLRAQSKEYCRLIDESQL